MSADVWVKQKTVSEDLGGFGNATVNGTLMTVGDRSRSEEANTEMNTAAAGPTGLAHPAILCSSQ